MEVERNLQDAMNVARNVMMDPRLCPGGGAIEMGKERRVSCVFVCVCLFLTCSTFRLLATSVALLEKAKTISGVTQWPYKSVARALEVIPRTLIQNCGANVIRKLTALRVTKNAPKCANHCVPLIFFCLLFLPFFFFLFFV